jgi:hypothetical protein
VPDRYERYDAEKILKAKEVEAAEQLSETVLTAISFPMKQGEQDVVQIQFEQFKGSKMIRGSADVR